MKLIAVAVLGLMMINQCLSDDEIDDVTTTTSTPDQSSSFYTAAVVEFHSPSDNLTDPEEIVDANLAEYLRLIYEASDEGIDILVFSEATLNYNGINSYENLTEMAVDINVEVPNTSDCVFSHDVILDALSFAAADASIYLLVNVVEMEPCNDTDESCKNGCKLFNSNVVFDRNGCIISRYRKFNLFLEPFMSVTSTPDLSTFETDFGVTFGHFVCFDILFKSPAMDLVKMNVSHFLYPSMWFSETPFLTSIQIQQAFAESNNIVLLSSGVNSPANANTGSGIFIGKHGAVETFISFQNESRMIMALIPKDVNDPEFQPTESAYEPYSAVEMEELKLWTYKPPNTNELSPNKVSSMDNVECEFTLNYTVLDSHDHYSYRLAVFSGIRSYLNITNAGEAHCAIVSCIDDMTCGQKFGDKTPSVQFNEIQIVMTIKEGGENVLVMPTTLDNAVNPIASKFYEFSQHVDEEVQKFTIRSSNVTRDMITFGIYGRHFSLDSKIVNEEASTMVHVKDFSDCTNEKEQVEAIEKDEDHDFTIKMIIYVVLMVVLSIITVIMTYKRLQTPYIKPNHNKRKSVNFNL